MKIINPITNEDMPALFQIADQVSLKSQKHYLLLMKLEITFIVLTSFLSIYAFNELAERKIITIVSAFFVGASLFTTALTRITQFEKFWFEGRTVAESVKTLTWRYITCADPYNRALSLEECDKKFICDLETIFKERDRLCFFQESSLALKAQISEKMRQFRLMGLQERKAMYLVERVQNQREWYSKKAELNRKLESRWFIALSITQFLTLVSAILIVIFTEEFFNVTGFFSTLTASIIAWIQLKQFQELAQSYGIAAQELGMIAEKGYYIQKEDEFSYFVSDSENAISRENTMWIARRDRR